MILKAFVNYFVRFNKIIRIYVYFYYLNIFMIPNVWL